MGPPFRGLYSYACDRYGCNPKSYFMRHIEDKEVKMRHHGFTKSESYALAEVLKVSRSVFFSIQKYFITVDFFHNLYL